MNLLSLIIPVFHEEGNIEKNLRAIEEKINTLKKEVLIVYDFENDPTLVVVNKCKDKFSFPVTLFKNRYGGGALNAIKTGLEAAQSKYCLVTMADLSDDYEKVDTMVALAEDGYDIVCGSRYTKEGKVYRGPFFKQLLSRCAGLSLYYLVGIPTHDITNSFKLYRKEIFDHIPIESTGGFELGMEITVKAFKKGYKIGEVPCSWWDRSFGKSKFRLWKWLPHYLRWFMYALLW